jgi:hypothetical protein
VKPNNLSHSLSKKALTMLYYFAATLTAVLKDILIWITVIAVIIVVPLSISAAACLPALGM